MPWLRSELCGLRARARRYDFHKSINKQSETKANQIPPKNRIFSRLGRAKGFPTRASAKTVNTAVRTKERTKIERLGRRITGIVNLYGSLSPNSI
jgi:hypothetical protein